MCVSSNVDTLLPSPSSSPPHVPIHHSDCRYGGAIAYTRPLAALGGSSAFPGHSTSPTAQPQYPYPPSGVSVACAEAPATATTPPDAAVAAPAAPAGAVTAAAAAATVVSVSTPAPGGGSPAPFRVIEGMPPVRLLVTNTRVPKSTRDLVAGVRVLHDALPGVAGPIIAAIDAIAAACLAGIATQAEERRGDSLRASAAAPPSHPPPAPSRPSHSQQQQQRAGVAAAVSPPLRPELSPTLHTLLDRLIRVNQGLLNALGVGHAAIDAVEEAMRVVDVAAAAGLVAVAGGRGKGGGDGNGVVADDGGVVDNLRYSGGGVGVVEGDALHPVAATTTTASGGSADAPSPAAPLHTPAAPPPLVASGLRGGLATKLTGAGGGGCALTLLPPRMESAGPPAGGGGGAVGVGVDPLAGNASFEAALAGLRARGYDVFQTRVGGDGVLVRRGRCTGRLGGVGPNGL